MKRFFKWIGLTAAALVILLLAAAVILPLVFDPNDHKERIEEQASGALNRLVRLQGPIGWSVFPWLAIDLNDVTIANESGYQQALLMSVERASARVRLLPLLRGEIEVGTIDLRAPEVNLEVAANGRNNWDSIGGAREESGGAVDKLEVAGLAIGNGKVNYLDRPAGLELTLSSVNLSSGPIQAEKPVQVKLDLELASADIKSQLAGRATIRGLLSGGALNVTMDQLELTGQAGQLPFTIELAEPAELDGAADTLTAPAVLVQSGKVRLRTDVTGRNLSGETALAGHLDAPGFNARAWIEKVLGGDPGSSDPAALTDVSLAADWSMQGDQGELKNLLVQLDDSTIRGELSLSSIEAVRGRFEFTIDQLDLDRYLPAAPAEASAEEDQDLLAGLDFGNLQGRVVIDQLKVSGMTAEKVTMAVQSSSQGIDFDPITADFYGGSLDSGLSLRPGAQRDRVQLRQDLQGVQAGPMLEDLLGRKVLTGLGNLTADIKLDRPRTGNPLAAANGSIAYTFNDGQLFGVNVFGTVRKALVLMGRAEEADDEDSDEQAATDFSSLVLKAEIVDGVLTTRQFQLLSPVLEMNGQVTLNLVDRSLRGTIEPALLAAGAKAHGLQIGSLAGVPLPVGLAGTYDAPKLALDPAKLLLASQRGKLDDRKAQLLDRLSGSSRSSDSKEPPADGTEAPAEGEDSEKESSKEQVARGLLNSLLKKPDETSDQKEDGDSGENDSG